MGTGAEILIQFGVWNYGRANPDASPFPTGLGLTLLIASSPAGLVSSGADLSLNARLESLNGLFSLPFENGGYLRSRAGTMCFSDGRCEILTIIEGRVALSQDQSALLFNQNVSIHGDAALLRLRNLGPEFTIAPGPGYTVRNGVHIAGVRGAGPVETAGIVGAIGVEAPEPAVWMLCSVGLSAVLLRVVFSTSRRSRATARAQGSAGLRKA